MVVAELLHELGFSHESLEAVGIKTQSLVEIGESRALRNLVGRIEERSAESGKFACKFANGLLLVGDEGVEAVDFGLQGVDAL